MRVRLPPGVGERIAAGEELGALMKEAVLEEEEKEEKEAAAAAAAVAAGLTRIVMSPRCITSGSAEPAVSGGTNE